MAAQDAVSPTTNKRNKHLEDVSDAAFYLGDVGVEDYVITDDINNNIFETIPDWGTDYGFHYTYNITKNSYPTH